MSEEHIRKEYEREVNEKIKELTRYLFSAQKNYDKAVSNDANTVLLELRKNKIDPLKIKLESLSKLLNSIENGGEQEEITKRFTDLNDNLKKQEISKEKLHKKKILKSTEESKTLTNFFGKERALNKVNREITRDKRRLYNIICKSMTNFPDYIKQNLKDMPNNKGYIWRNVYYWGEKDYDPTKPCILFEKTKYKLYIHEITDTQHILFEKSGKQKKILIKKEERNQDTNNYRSLQSFIN